MFKIISCCCKSGQKKRGPEIAPKLIVDEITKYTTNFTQTNISDEEFTSNIGYQRLYDASLSEFRNILTLGGDHSIGISTVFASLYKYKEKTKVIWVDAHADINTYNSSTTKNKHGMPLSPCFNLMNPWIRINNEQTYLQPSQLVYIGLRSVDEPEKEIIQNMGIKAYYSTDVAQLGIKNIMKEIMTDDETIYHLSFDIDGIDPKYTPSTGTAEGSGISLNDGIYIVESLVGTGHLKSFDLVEYNPLIGSDNDSLKTLNSCMELVRRYIRF
jgi:arginase